MTHQEHRFAISDVAPGEHFPEQVPLANAVASLIGEANSIMDAGSNSTAVIPSRAHGLIDTASLAFDHHLPLVIGPDDIWLAILQGYSNHPRPSVEPKLNLVVVRNDFLHLNPKPWPEVFQSFSDQIRTHLGSDRHQLLTARYSTTGKVELASFNVATMAAMKNRFTYEFLSICGIPEVRLLGTPGDWASLSARAQKLVRPEMKWWWAKLSVALKHLQNTSQGKPDISAWKSFFKWNQESGGPYVNGWINAFVPYLFDNDEAVRNHYFGPGKSKAKHRTSTATLENLPSPLASAPIIWKRPDGDFNLLFLAGFVGTTQRQDTSVRPAIGWAVVQSTNT